MILDLLAIHPYTLHSVFFLYGMDGQDSRTDGSGGPIMYGGCNYKILSNSPTGEPDFFAYLEFCVPGQTSGMSVSCSLRLFGDETSVCATEAVLDVDRKSTESDLAYCAAHAPFNLQALQTGWYTIVARVAYPNIEQPVRLRGEGVLYLENPSQPEPHPAVPSEPILLAAIPMSILDPHHKHWMHQCHGVLVRQKSGGCGLKVNLFIPSSLMDRTPYEVRIRALDEDESCVGLASVLLDECRLYAASGGAFLTAEILLSVNDSNRCQSLQLEGKLAGKDGAWQIPCKGRGYRHYLPYNLFLQRRRLRDFFRRRLGPVIYRAI